MLKFLLFNFLSSDTYIIGVQAFCIGNSCIKKTNFKALVDSGTSFTFVPEEVYEVVSEEVPELAFELYFLVCLFNFISYLVLIFYMQVYNNPFIQFDKRVNATRASYEGYPWKYCYKSR